MKQLFFFVIFLSFALPAFAAGSTCGEPLKVVAAETYAPMSFRANDGTLKGFELEFIEALFEQVGCSVSFVALPFKRAHIELKAGRVDVIPFSSYSESREAYSWFSQPYRQEVVGLFIRNGEAERYPVKSLNDIIKNRMFVGHKPDTFRGPRFQQFIQDPASEPHIFPVESAEEAVRMLVAKRIDAFVDITAAASSAATRVGAHNMIDTHPFTIWQSPVHFMFSKQSIDPVFVEKIDASIENGDIYSRIQKCIRKNDNIQ